MTIGIDTLLMFLGVGLAAGFFAGVITQGRGFGIVGNIIVGIIGAFIGFYVLTFLNVLNMAGFVGAFVKATFGAVAFLFVLRVFR